MSITKNAVHAGARTHEQSDEPDFATSGGAHPVVLEVKDRNALESTGVELGALVDERGPLSLFVAEGTIAAALAASMREWARQRRSWVEVLAALTPQAGTTLSAPAVLQARRNAAARHELIEEFGGLSSAEIADLAGSRAANRAALANRWRAEGRVFSVPLADGQRYPGFQFDEQTRPRPAIARALASLTQASDLSPWQLALWFTSANGYLGGKRPVDLLDADSDAVVEAACHEATDVVA